MGVRRLVLVFAIAFGVACVAAPAVGGDSNKATTEAAAKTAAASNSDAPYVLGTKAASGPIQEPDSGTKAEDATPKTDIVVKTDDAKTEKPEEPKTIEDIGLYVKKMVRAAQDGHWALFAGFLVMILTRLFNLLLRNKIPSRVMPWIALSLGVVGDGAFILANSGSWLDAIVGGITAGITAAGSYSIYGKHLPGLKSKSS